MNSASPLNPSCLYKYLLGSGPHPQGSVGGCLVYASLGMYVLYGVIVVISNDIKPTPMPVIPVLSFRTRSGCKAAGNVVPCLSIERRIRMYALHTDYYSTKSIITPYVE